MKLKHDHTYEARIKIKALGGKWNKEDESWDVPFANYAKALLACLEAESDFWQSEYNDPENVAGDLDSIERKWANCTARIKELEAQINSETQAK